MKKILKKESGKVASIKPKASAADLKGYFSDLVEGYDEDRVYSSDIKKIIQWYNILVTKKIITLEKYHKKITTLEKYHKKNHYFRKVSQKNI